MFRCQLLPSRFGPAPRCRGDIAVGNPCNDGDGCTKDDACAIEPEENRPSPFDFGRRCRGVLDTEATCNDFNDCTNNDRCVFLGSDEGYDPGFIACRGDVLTGQPCDDYNQCTFDDQCAGNFPFSGFCAGTPNIGAPCYDYNQCTADDECMATDYGDMVQCRGGRATIGETCNDYIDCTVNDVCIERDFGYGIPTEVLCMGSPSEGGPCNDYNDCTGDDICYIGLSGDYSFCRGQPIGGVPCIRDPCSVNNMCVLGDSGSYSYCDYGEPTPGVPCDDGNMFSVNDMCQDDDFGGVICRGTFGS